MHSFQEVCIHWDTASRWGSSATCRTMYVNRYTNFYLFLTCPMTFKLICSPSGFVSPAADCQHVKKKGAQNTESYTTELHFSTFLSLDMLQWSGALQQYQNECAARARGIKNGCCRAAPRGESTINSLLYTCTVLHIYTGTNRRARAKLLSFMMPQVQTHNCLREFPYATQKS